MHCVAREPHAYHARPSVPFAPQFTAAISLRLRSSNVHAPLQHDHCAASLSLPEVGGSALWLCVVSSLCAPSYFVIIALGQLQPGETALQVCKRAQ